MMESKLLVGGKNIVDHTNEQQRMLELKRQEIAEQVHQQFEGRATPVLPLNPFVSRNVESVRCSSRWRVGMKRRWS